MVCSLFLSPSTDDGSETELFAKESSSATVGVDAAIEEYGDIIDDLLQITTTADEIHHN